MTEFFRFPNTPHLLWLGEGQPRDDKILSNAEVAALLRDKVLIEENRMVPTWGSLWTSR